MKNAIDVAVPETAFDVIKWHSAASMRYGELKMAMGGIDASLNTNILSDGPTAVRPSWSSNSPPPGPGSAMRASRPFSRYPASQTPAPTLEEHLYFVKDSFGNWLLDGTRTLNDKP